MAISGKSRHDELATIMRRHFNATASRCGWGENAEDIICELLEKVAPAIAAVEQALPVGFPEDVALAIFAGMRLQAQKLREQPSA